MRRLFLAAALVALAAGAARAQAQAETPRVEVFGGYAYGGANTHGWQGSVAVNVKSWLGLVSDFGGSYSRFDSPDVSERIRTYSFLFGPRFSLRRSRRVTPFVHALLGAAHTDSRAHELGFDFHGAANGFATALGGGLDVRLGGRVAVRVIQLDYLHTTFYDDSQNSGRASAGLVIRLGGK